MKRQTGGEAMELRLVLSPPFPREVVMLQLLTRVGDTNPLPLDKIPPTLGCLVGRRGFEDRMRLGMQGLQGGQRKQPCSARIERRVASPRSTGGAAAS